MVASTSKSRAIVVARRYHMHFPGVVYLFVTIVLLLGAIKSQNNLLFWLFGLAVGGLIVSGILSAASLMGLSIRRELPPSAVAGQPLRIVYRLRTTNWVLPALGLTIEEMPGQGERAGNWPLFASSIVTFLPRAGRAFIPVEAVLVPSRRGRLTLRLVRVWTTFPFGLAKKSVTFLLAEEVLVRPAPATVPGTLANLSGGRSHARRAQKRDRTGDDFFAIRDHHPGDSIRTIAWRPSARLDRLIVRDSARTPERRVWLRLRPESGDLEPLLSLAAGAALALRDSGCAVGLLGPAGEVLEGPRGGAGASGSLLDALARYDVPGAPGAGHLHPADGVLFVSHQAADGTLSPFTPGVTLPACVTKAQEGA